MRILLPLFAVLLLTACSNDTHPENTAPPEQEVPAHAVEAPPAPAPANLVELHSLVGSGLKFNGVYDSHTTGNIHYFMRFFERGNVALIAGQQQPDDRVDIRTYLTENAKSGENNVHNTPVIQRNDSLFFSTMATRGAITYAGVVDGDSLRFIKHSKVTGKKALVTYGFIPD